MSSAEQANRGEEGAAGSNWSVLRFLVRGHERLVGGLAVSSVLSGIAEAAILASVAQAAATLLTNVDTVSAEIGPLSFDVTVATLLIVAGALALARIGLQAVVAASSARLAAGAQAQLRNGLFGAFTRASWSSQAVDREGHLQEMLTSQIVQATFGTLQLSTLVSGLLTFFVLIASAMLLNGPAALLVVAVAIAIFGLLRPLSALGQESARQLSLAQMDYANGVGEAVRMAAESRVFGVEEAQRARMADRVAAARRLFFSTQFVGRLVPSLFQGLIYLTVIGGLGLLYGTGAGRVASLGAVVLILIRAGSYGQQVQSSYQAVRQALPFVERLKRAVERYEENREVVQERPLAAIDRIGFADVSFAYRSGEPVLSDVGFEVSKGEAIGIVGPSGAGKSTLVQVLLRLRQPDRGAYLVNGAPAERFAAADWHRQVAYVPQEPRLLHASVADNIRFFREIDQAAIERAARLARIHDDVLTWRAGYDTIVGPRADSVSGGQQQRICLARALAANPSVLVLDEPTSALDPRSESLIQDSLRELSHELTVFLVTHRMSALAICDRVMVIVDGRVEAFDSPEALKQAEGYFGAALELGEVARSEFEIGVASGTQRGLSS
jgi:ABC-type multidrug transport system fused ATPase/permease subunit